jgi:large subunit ribosomal protein L14
MIQAQTVLKIADNSGIKLVKCIKILGNSKCANIGDVIVVSSIKFKDNNSYNLKKGSIYKAIVLKTKKHSSQKNGFFIKFKANTVLVIDNQHNPIGSRILTLLPKKLKKKFPKLVGIAPYLL